MRNIGVRKRKKSLRKNHLKPGSAKRNKRIKKYTHYNVHMSPADFKYLNPKEARL